MTVLCISENIHELKYANFKMFVGFLNSFQAIFSTSGFLMLSEGTETEQWADVNLMIHH